MMGVMGVMGVMGMMMAMGRGQRMELAHE